MNDGALDQTVLPTTVGKQRAACDECRAKKLRCTGEQPSCSRCQREQILCIYSPKKQMGRPKKRRKSEELAQPEDDRVAFGQVPHEISQAAWNRRDNPIEAAPDFSDPQLMIPEELSIATCRATTQRHSIPELNDSSSEFPVPELTPDGSGENLTPLEDGMSAGLPAQCAHSMGCTPLERGLGKFSEQAPAPLTLPLPPPLLTTCACLSSMYLSQNTLSSMTEPFVFPFLLQPLREAMQTTADIIDCQVCPQRALTALQNIQSIGGLLVSIVERFAKALDSITAESVRAEAAGETKSFRLGDLSSSNIHLHTDRLNDAVQFSVTLSPAEWKRMVKKVIYAEVHGPMDGDSCCPSLQDLFTRMRARQLRWHSQLPPSDVPEAVMASALERAEHPAGEHTQDEEHLCLKYVDFADRLVQKFDWT